MSRLLSLFLFLALAFSAAAAELVAIDTPVLLPNEAGYATTVLHLHNVGASAVKLQLSLSDFEHQRAVSGDSKQGSPTTYALGTVALLTGLDADSEKKLAAGVLEPGAILAVKVAVDHLWEAGASRARVYNQGQPVTGPDGQQATLKAVRVPAQYNIQLESAGGVPEIRFKGSRGQVRIRNNDAMNYDFTWELRTADQVKQGWIELPASSSTTVDVSSAAPSVSWMDGLLKEPREDADFVLKPAFVDVHQPAASKTFPVKLRMSWDSPFQQFVNVLFLILLLTLGGILSVLVHWGIPNTSRALDLRKRVWELQTKLNGTGEMVAYKWRVTLGAQIEWVRREVRSAHWVLPAFATTLDEIEQKMQLFEKWIDTAYEVSIVREQSKQLQQKQRLPPTLLKWLGDHCDHALEPIETGHTTAEELAAMQTELNCARLLVKGATGANEALETDIKDRERLIAKKIDDLKQAFGLQFGNLIDDFRNSHEEPLEPAVYVDRDIIAVKLMMLSEFRDCVRHSELMEPSQRAAAAGAGMAATMSGAGSVVADKPNEHRDRFFDCLRTDYYEQLCRARMYLEEMHQAIFPEAMMAELTPEPQLKIVTEPRVIAPGAPVRVSLVFNREILNIAVARQEWTCTWNFDDGTAPRAGWSVFHTFPKHGSFNISVQLSGSDGREIRHDAITARLKVDPLPTKHAETILEASRLGLVLAATVFGLLTTAQDKIQDLTFLEAAAAVMVLGFSADTLKNLVTRSKRE